MDIHRCRFVPYPASPINALAFSHPSLKKSSYSHPVRLAVGRANGDIEIWNPQGGNWFQETIIHGARDRSIDGLVWVTEEDELLEDGNKIRGTSRLFSIGYSNTVTEWDLEKGKAKKHASGQHGDIWCLGVQPLPPKDQTNGAASARPSRRLVAGTVDGSLALYSIDEDDLRLQRVLVKTPSKKVKMVSIAFQSRQVVIVGCSDSSIRVYDLRNGSLIRKMTLGSDLTGGSKEIIVWSVKCLKNGDIVSGDSIGQITIWDGKTYTQAQRIQGHKQDVLSLATSADGSSIISGGMDRRTVLYRPIAPNSSRWGKVWHTRYHNHDVKAMASFESKDVSVVVSGGPDATPVVTPLRKSGQELHRTLSHLPQSLPLQGASKARLIVSWWEREVQIWSLQRPVGDLLDTADAGDDMAKNRKLLGRILIKGDSNINSATISKDGTFLVVSTNLEVKAFHLTVDNSKPKEEIKIRKIEVPLSLSQAGASAVMLSPDGRWLTIIQEGTRILIAKIIRDEDSESQITLHPRASKLDRLKRKIPKHMLLGGLRSYNRRITHLAFSADSKMLATADLAGFIDTWTLRDAHLQNGSSAEEEEDDASSSSSSSSDGSDDEMGVVEAGPRWVRNPKARLIPKLPASPVVLSFSDDVPGKSGDGLENRDDYTLLTITVGSRILLFHPLSGSLTDWARKNPHSCLPEELRKMLDLAKGALWQGSRLWLYGVSYIFMLDLSQNFSHQQSTALVPSDQKNGTKRKRGTESGAGGRMPQSEALYPHQVRKAATDGAQKDQWVDIEMTDAEEEGAATSGDQEDEDEDEDEDETDGGELQLLRNGQQGHDAGDKPKGDERRKWWHTYKFRPILGIVPLESSSSQVEDTASDGARETAANGDVLSALEVALVERPIWDVDLPPRYFGEDEYER